MDCPLFRVSSTAQSPRAAWCSQNFSSDTAAPSAAPCPQAPRALGAWTMVAIVTASMSTADGAILATSTVMAHNLWRKVGGGKLWEAAGQRTPCPTAPYL